MSTPSVPQIVPITNKQIKDITGQRFNRLSVIGYVGSRSSGNAKHAYWLCRCDCGNVTVIEGWSLRIGRSKSCGCHRREMTSLNGKARRTHGMTETPEFRTWKSMLERCNNPNISSYPYYGGRSIKVCEHWKSFENFFADMGPRPGKAHSLDRVDNDGDYCPENCRWATLREQGNNRRGNQHITYKNETHTVAEWARIRRIEYYTLWSRLFNLHWSIEDSLTKPVYSRKA